MRKTSIGRLSPKVPTKSAACLIFRRRPLDNTFRRIGSVMRSNSGPQLQPSTPAGLRGGYTRTCRDCPFWLLKSRRLGIGSRSLRLSELLEQEEPVDAALLGVVVVPVVATSDRMCMSIGSDVGESSTKMVSMVLLVAPRRSPNMSPRLVAKGSSNFIGVWGARSVAGAGGGTGIDGAARGSVCGAVGSIGTDQPPVLTGAGMAQPPICGGASAAGTANPPLAIPTFMVPRKSE